MIAIKITGPIFTVNSTPNTVPTNAATGSNAAQNTESGGYGNSTVGGATFVYLVNGNSANANVTVANSSGNIGTLLMLSNTFITLTKGAYETIVSTPNTIATPIAKLW